MIHESLQLNLSDLCDSNWININDNLQIEIIHEWPYYNHEK